MPMRRRIHRRSRDRIFLFLGLAIIAGLGWFALYKTGRRTPVLRLSAGSAGGLRHAMAESLTRVARRKNLEIVLVPTVGSEAALDQVHSGAIDLALVQGGLLNESRAQVRQVAALHVEPLHLLVKPELYSATSKSLDALRNHSVNLSEPGSGTHTLALEVLRFAGMTPESDLKIEERSYEQLASETDVKALPDAIFMVSLLPSRVARVLINKHGYRLVPLPFGEAFSLGALAREGKPGGPSEIVRDHVIEAVIPAFCYGIRSPEPPEPVRTLGTRLLLVANSNVDAESVAALLETAFRTPFAQLAHPPLSEKLLDLPPEIPEHAGTDLFRERSKPIHAGDVIDSVEKELSIAGAVLGATFFLWQWVRSRIRKHREDGVESYLVQVGSIESQALALELASSLDLKELLRLQSELGRIKAEVIGKIADDEIQGDDLITGFLTHASDARDHLTRMILHERDHLQRQARAENRDASDLWQEAVGQPIEAS